MESTAMQKLVAAFRAAAHAAGDDHFIEQARGAEQALAESRLNVGLATVNFMRLIEGLGAEAQMEADRG